MSAYLLTWNPDKGGWSGNYEDSVGDEPFTGRWSVSQGQQIDVGDRVYLLRQRAAPIGIVASGRVTKTVFEQRHWDTARQGKPGRYVMVRWDTLLDLVDALLRNDLETALPGGRWRPQQSGEKVREGVEADLERTWRSHVRAATGRSPVEVPVVITDVDGEPVWETFQGGHAKRVTKARRGQATFRKALFGLYGSTCAITGPAPQAALQAAHLYAFADEAKHHERGGLLLRADIHRLFDDGQITVDANDKVVIDASLKRWPAYGALNGHALNVSLTDPQREWLAAHRDAFGA